jgi:transcriptional regulator
VPTVYNIPITAGDQVQELVERLSAIADDLGLKVADQHLLGKQKVPQDGGVKGL